ncbi:uncharacterized protein CTRU02_208127 [Colletotrichum truncatum]|uniref:Uncharacterized protein n=1 Tax=Colletotrichum truncatum TaxID=5467 RepID=A0ACC3YYD6_COLTU|nr:uncharacterized protein CTRU02_14974 [Colletotrichum truncatum]KAF6781567.1 hypothetical protein CTRU02_14974 [Colletotrichum truncatum]
MSTRRRNRIIAPSSLLISYLASASSAAFQNDFSAYPAASRSCLDKAAASSGCTGETVIQMNSCLCGNGGNFVTSSATCVAKTAKDKLGAVYEMLLTSCTDSNTPLAVSQAQFLDAEDDDDDDKSTTSHSTTFTTSTTPSSPPPTIPTPPQVTSSSTYIPVTTYKSVANGVTVTITRGVDSVPTGTNVGKGSSTSPDDENTTDDEGGSKHGVLAAGLVGGLAILAAVLAFLFYRRRKQRRERAGAAGPGGKFGALSSATSLTTMNSPPQGAATAQYHNINDQRPDTAGTTHMNMGAGQWNQQHQQYQQPQQQQQQYQQGNLSPQYWQQQNGQSTGNWPSPVSNGPVGTWGVSPVSQYPPGTSNGSPSMQNGTWNGQSSTMRDGTWDAQTSAANGTWNAHAVPVPAPIPHPSTSTHAPVFELAGDNIQAVEADSTPIGYAQGVPAQQQQLQQAQQQQQQQYSQPSSIQATPQLSLAHPAQPAPAHHGMPRQVDDALQISQVELPPPRYTGPSSPRWVSEDKKFG